MFPFGQPIRRVEQVDQTPKKVFVLGVYSSAVHARWCDPHGKELVKALAVASEPYIFWRGENADQITSSIVVPDGVGNLEPAANSFNGPSGRSLDDQFLNPLGLKREQVWLCDCIPQSCMNQGQSNALWREYYKVAEHLALPPVNWPCRPTQIPPDRVDELAGELHRSQAEIVITLGDEPLKWFAKKRLGSKNRLKFYGTDATDYGQFHNVKFGDRTLRLLPLVHPRQAARMPGHTTSWANLHDYWIKHKARHMPL